ncbi:MAG: ATP-dependent sacrificial sulfur transferase LarE [Spirochaetes bacterium]|nr:MAG: ATP-dependent sacrificial sulfur transferase LarE [Spirochaetota bacterium]
MTKLAFLKELIRACESALVAFSGGVDSALVLAVAREALGGRVLAVTAVSDLHAPEERGMAEEIAQILGVRHEVAPIDLLAVDCVRANTRDRCYHCKKEIFSGLIERARAERLACVLDGTNADDEGAYRPGKRALAELGVKSPLRDAGLSKDEVRELARMYGLPSHDRPAAPCLATRIPYGTALSADILKRIGLAEKLLHERGFRVCRVRVHGDVARIEVPRADMPAFLDGDFADALTRDFRGLGFAYIALDIRGFRSGSMDETG